MDCCGDLSDDSVDWYNLLLGRIPQDGTFSSTTMYTYVPIRIVSLYQLNDINDAIIINDIEKYYAYQLIYNIPDGKACSSVSQVSSSRASTRTSTSTSKTPSSSASASTTSSNFAVPPATTVFASPSCKDTEELDTNVKADFASTTRVITPQWIEDSGYSVDLDKLNSYGYPPDEPVTLHEYFGYLFTFFSGDYTFNSQFLDITLSK
ncbi:unnamed protein product [[Candida] boidinii]|nr:unnamed protein product [[Candida] boidinii]